MKRMMILGLLLIFLAGCYWKPVQLPEVTDFESCVAAGNPVMESPPRQCRHKDITFTEMLLGGDEDEHGCKPSAGYQWCESAQKCIRYWETECMCGGIAGFPCAAPYECELDGDYPDASGKCVGEGARGLGVGEAK